MAHYSRYGHGLVEPVKKRASARSKEHHSTSHRPLVDKALMVVIMNDVICPPKFQCTGTNNPHKSVPTYRLH